MDTETIIAVLESDEFSEADRCAIRWQYALLGSFYTRLFETIMNADAINMERLARGFPNEVAGYRNWTRGDLYKRFNTACVRYRVKQKMEGATNETTEGQD
jgi:hypothetical protein